MSSYMYVTVVSQAVPADMSQVLGRPVRTWAATTATATKTSLKNLIRPASNFIALIPSRSIRQMLAFFSRAEF